MEDKIQEIMGLVCTYGHAKSRQDSFTNHAVESLHKEIESKLRKLIERCSVREPLPVQYPRDMNSINAQFVFSAGWSSAERAHNITNTDKE